MVELKPFEKEENQIKPTNREAQQWSGTNMINAFWHGQLLILPSGGLSYSPTTLPLLC